MTSAVIALLVATLMNALVIWIVGKLGLGIDIKNFGTAFVAAFLIAAIWALLDYFHIAGPGQGFLSSLVRLVVSALVLMLVGNILKGMVTKGFLGAIIAALAMTAVYWMINYILASALY